MKAFKTLKRVRIGIYLILFAVLAVLALRYETVSLPEEGCSPLDQFRPGGRLLLDRWRDPEVGDAVLFRAGDELLLGRVLDKPSGLPAELPESWASFDDDHLWIVGDVADCPAVDSRSLGPIARSDISAVVAAGLPW